MITLTHSQVQFFQSASVLVTLGCIGLLVWFELMDPAWRRRWRRILVPVLAVLLVLIALGAAVLPH